MSTIRDDAHDQHRLGDLIVAGRRLHLDARTVVSGAIGVRDGRVAWLLIETGLDAQERWPDASIIDAGDAHVIPGLVDAHVHLRDPGQTHKEDIASGTSAAAAGAITTVIAQPNTVPEIADLDALATLHERVRAAAVVDVGVSARLPWRDPDTAHALAGAGVCAFDLTFAGIPRDELRDALALAAALDVPLGIFAEDPDVVAGNRARLGSTAGARGDALVMTPAAEASACRAVLAALRDVPASIVFRQVSSQLALEVLLEARSSGDCPAFAIEVTPHHLMLDASHVETAGERARIWPPLRSRADVEFVWSAVRDGHVDLIGSDHSPHAASEKDRPQGDPQSPPPGFPGLETALPALLTGPYGGCAGLDIERIIELYAEAPARLMGLAARKGHLRIGADADLAIVDAASDQVVDAQRHWTKSKTSPFDGIAMRGRVLTTLVRGVVVYRDAHVHGREGSGELLLRAGPASRTRDGS